ncbi:MAG: hypothetical protein JWO81_708 [Alphaproteobacteria bacterium]|nr:hypothetical protein [Alphaproteobacteria bacterium]
MPESSEPVLRQDFHRAGTIKARGHEVDGLLSGYWEWFRKDGTRLRSGWFEKGEQVGEWTTYDVAGQGYKVTVFKPRSG